MRARGRCSPVYSVHCGGCGAHHTPASPHEQASAAGCGASAKAAGWANTRAFGWMCRQCEDDTVGVILGTAAHIQPEPS